MCEVNSEGVAELRGLISKSFVLWESVVLVLVVSHTHISSQADRVVTHSTTADSQG